MAFGLQVFDENSKETVNSNQTLLNVVAMGTKTGSGLVTIPPGLTNPLIAISPDATGTGSTGEYRYGYATGDMINSFGLIGANAQPYSYAILSQQTVGDPYGLRVVNPDGSQWNAARKLFQIDAISYQYANNWVSIPTTTINIPQSRPGKLWVILNTMSYVFTNYVSGSSDIRRVMAIWRTPAGVTQCGGAAGGSDGVSICDTDTNGAYLSIISGFID